MACLSITRHPIRVPVPELPEVERAARRLRRVAVGRQIARIELLHPALQRQVSALDVASLTGCTIVAVEQQAKHQRVVLNDGRSMHVHFRMAGDWDVGISDDALPRHARAVLSLEDGGRVTLVDPRALSTIQIFAAGAIPNARLGPNPFSKQFTADWLGTALKRRRGAIKPVLLDQGVVAGVGNIYAAEALWEARISPRAIASKLSAPRRLALVGAIRIALRRGRGTRSRYNEAFEGRFRVYDRAGEACPRCGSTIRRIVQAGRSTYYCPRCQAR
jgi:formamidopyrimidine-DNA glycosylase